MGHAHHCPCKDVYVFSLCKDECTLQRARGWVSWGPILGCMCMLHDLWNQFFNVIKVWKMDDCFDHSQVRAIGQAEQAPVHNFLQS